MTSKGIATGVVLSVLAAGFLGGCQRIGDQLGTDRTRFLNPSQVVPRISGTPVMPILTNLTPADQTLDIPAHAEQPRDEDYVYSDLEYVVGPRDVIDVSVMDLYQEGLETLIRREVSDAGFLDLPLLPDRVRVEGLTKPEIVQAIRSAYSPDILIDPIVTVTVVARRQDLFSVLGAISRPGTYNLTRPDMRLLEALALAGGRTQPAIRHIYVIRQARPQPLSATPSPLGPGMELPPLPEIPRDPAPTAPQPAAPDDRLFGPFVPPAPADPQPVDVRPEPPVQEPVDPFRELDESLDDWRSPEPVAPPSPPRLAEALESAPAGQPTMDRFGWGEIDRSHLARVIAIDLDRLESGDPRMNIVIRPNDVIHVPSLDIGEFYVVGEVRSPGAYSLTGRRVTVKQAIAAAGNLGPFAWPENALIYRRISPTQEQIIPIDIQAIFRGTDPDVLLKKDDVLAVGSDWRVSFFAVMRNAFRMTYGFGFIYDRNFANPLFVTPTSRRFTRL